VHAAAKSSAYLKIFFIVFFLNFMIKYV